MIPRFAAILALCVVGACSNAERASSSDSVQGGVRGVRVDLTGAGATFPYPLYSRWFNDYAQRTNVRINYQSIGSGAGIRQLSEGTVDFGATDVPMTDAELAQHKTPIYHIPTVLGAVAITYNLPGLSRPLRLSGPLLANIFRGKVTRWNAPEIAELNPGVPLPASDILVVHRADGSGTSYIFSDYLSSVSAEWAGNPGRGKDVRWPVGIGGRGNEGVAGQVKQMVGAIGYVEVVYARQNYLPVAHLQNKSGRFISPMPYEIARAAATTMTGDTTAKDLRVSLVNADDAQAYPITSLTWMLLDPVRIGPQKTEQLINFLRWALNDGAEVSGRLGYTALPSVAVARVLEVLDTLSTAPRTRQ
ncbi:MAG: phosphate ABC transporter substrate-binding protein PstS [Gemmatimonadaceae bacterium]|nr:phosphate ABC transporter substrate-binding protein PstS [Gemmatimonadaceae bacterium]